MKRTTKNFFSQKAFTLTEILVVVGIIGILMAVAFVGYRSFQRETALDTAAAEIINTLRKAQSMSITVKEASKFGVHFDAASQKYVLFEGDTWNTRNPSSDEEHSIRSELEMYDIVFAETGNDVIFNKITGGTPNYGSLKVNIKANPGNYRIISVNPEGKIGEYELTEDIPPGSFSLVSPTKGSVENTTLLPNFDWEDSSGSGITYTFWHSSDPNFNTKTEIPGILNSHYTLQTGQELENYKRNYWKVKAVNAAGVETWSREGDWYLDVSVSNPPDDFSLLNPTDGYSETSSLTPTFDWEDTTDPDGDPLTYTLEHSTNTLFNPKTEITLISNSEYTPNQSEGLANHTTNYWRVYAIDSNGASKLCREGYWSVNTDVNFAPDAFSLVSPANSEVVTTTTPTLDWDDASDPDPGDSVTYTIWYSTDPTFSSKTEVAGLSSSDYTVPAGSPLNSGDTYYWKVKAVDSHGAETWSSQQDWNYYVDQPPGNFSLISPTNGSSVGTVTPSFDWSDSVDPDSGDTITYTLWVDDDSDFSSLLIDKTGLTSSEYTAEVADGLQDGYTYYWKVEAIDNYGAETWSDETDWSFNISISGCHWHVDGSVGSSGDGLSWATAFKTINDAVNVLSGGETVCIANSVYSEEVGLQSGHSGTAANNTIFKNKEGDTDVIIDGPNNGYGFRIQGADYVHIEGLKITGARYGVMFYNGTDNSTVDNCEIYGNSRYGVYFHSSNGGYNAIKNSKIYNNNRYGIYAVGTKNQIYDNNIYDNSLSGIYVDRSDPQQIYENLIHGNGREGIYINRGSDSIIHHNQIYDNSEEGIYIYRPSGHHIYNNTVDGNAREGLYVNRSTGPIKIRNNNLTDNNCGFRVQSGNSNIDNDYNDVWGNASNYCGQGSTYQGTNSISSDPLYVDSANNNFLLEAGSPCIDRGDPDPFYNDPDGSRSDIGALHYRDLTEWYVDQSVPASGIGISWDTAFKTIAEAVAVTDSGDTVHIANGTYNEQVDLNYNHSGSASDYTEFIPREGDENVIIDGSTYGFFMNNADYVKVENLKVTGSNYGIYLYNGSDHNIFSNNEIYNNSYYGFFTNYGGDNIVSNNSIHGNTYGGVIGLAGNGNVFHHNLVYNSNYYGIYMYRPWNFHVYNNTINDVGYYGLYFYYGSSSDPAVLRNNISTNNLYGFYASYINSGLDSDYNDIWNNTYDYTGVSAGPNSISQDPQFVDAGVGDFHLQSGSPCIGTGDPDSFYNNPDGSRSDMGALWYEGGMVSVIFDDDYGPDWKGHWSVEVVSSPVYGSDGFALKKDNGMRFDSASDDGVVIEDNPVLQARVNFIIDGSYPGHSITSVRVSTSEGTNFEFDERGDGCTYYLDGVEYTDVSELFFDTDPNTWQLFEIDLSQADYSGWPIVTRYIEDKPVTNISFDTYGNTTGDAMFVVDDVKLTN